jgi:hypothetical protein
MQIGILKSDQNIHIPSFEGWFLTFIIFSCFLKLDINPIIRRQACWGEGGSFDKLQIQTSFYFGHMLFCFANVTVP